MVYLGGVQLRLFRYRDALESTEGGEDIARRIEPGEAPAQQTLEKQLMAGAEINTSTVYVQLGNFSLARQKLTRAIAILAGSDRKDLLADSYFSLSYQQIRLGDLEAGIKASETCIKFAQQAKDLNREAKAWDLRGIALVLANDTRRAEASLEKAVDLYRAAGRASIPAVTLEHLGELKWKERQLPAAIAYVDQAFASADAVFKTSPQYYPLSVRAGILRDMGRTDDALQAYRKAVDAANLWRRSALPGDATNMETVRELNDTYHSFAELAAEQSLLRHDQSLAREAFDALSRNRAASLREQLAVEMGRNQTLPAEYLAKLGEFQSVQAHVTLEDAAAGQARLADLENQIAEMETRIGLSGEKRSPFSEKSPTKNSLRDIQSNLSTTEALLSFCLGEQSSFLWAVTSDSMNLYRLPDARDISTQAKSLRTALEERRTFSTPAATLSSDLFSQLNATIWQKPDWLIVGDGALLDRVPFAVLPVRNSSSGQPLVEEHRIRILPSELLLLSRQSGETEPRFVGVADPLYNLADSRRLERTSLVNTSLARGSSALARLPGSQREVRAAAAASGVADVNLLIGRDATIQRLAEALAQHPTIVHFAVHVVSPPGHPEQAAIALSLGPDNIPELLTREKVASLRVPGSLIVLSGCSSGQGQTAPSAGLIGLSRAWLLAGASAVIVSNWPTPDDSGQLFRFFYSDFSSHHSGTIAERAAKALQQAQIDVQRRGGYGSSARFWAAYSIISKE